MSDKQLTLEQAIEQGYKYFVLENWSDGESVTDISDAVIYPGKKILLCEKEGRTITIDASDVISSLDQHVMDQDECPEQLAEDCESILKNHKHLLDDFLNAVNKGFVDYPSYGITDYFAVVPDDEGGADD